MSLTEENYRNYDVDCFFIAGNKLCHLASFGGELPREIVASFKTYQEILTIVSLLPQRFCVIVEEQQILYEREKGNKLGADLYLRTFEAMASRGFYSFDRVQAENGSEDSYKLVARPIIENNSHDYQSIVQSLETELPNIQRDLPSDCKEIELSALFR